MKHDGGKPRFDLVPPHGLAAVARVMTAGAAKYGEQNYLNDRSISDARYVAAALRHINAVQCGEALDPETGEHHFAHAASNLLMLLEVMADRGEAIEPESPGWPGMWVYRAGGVVPPAKPKRRE